MVHTLAAATEQRSGAAPSITFAIEGPFDGQTAFQIAHALARTTRTAMVHVDFRRVGAVQDTALAILAEAIRKAEPDHVVLHGLGHHQQVILHYLGAEARQPGE